MKINKKYYDFNKMIDICKKIGYENIDRIEMGAKHDRKLTEIYNNGMFYWQNPQYSNNIMKKVTIEFVDINDKDYFVKMNIYGHSGSYWDELIVRFYLKDGNKYDYDCFFERLEDFSKENYNVAKKMLTDIESGNVYTKSNLEWMKSFASDETIDDMVLEYNDPYFVSKLKDLVFLYETDLQKL